MTKNHVKSLNQYRAGDILHLKAIPNASRTELVEHDGQLRLYLHAPPDKDKANLELIKFFKQELNLRVELKSGARSREKVIRIL